MARAALVLQILAAAASIAPSLADCDYRGGYALRQRDECPPEAPVTCQDGYIQRCCPHNFTCRRYYGNMFCCPDEDDCYNEVRHFPQCAGGYNDWALYTPNNTVGYDPAEAFCCEPDATPVYIQHRDGVGCVPSGMDLAVEQTIAVIPTNTPSECPAGFSVTTGTGTSSGTEVTTMTATTTTTTLPTTGSSETVAGDEQASQTAGSASNSNSNDSDSDSLSTGAIAGIAVGSVAGAALIIGAAAWWFIRHRRQQRIPESWRVPTSASLPGGGGGYGSGSSGAVTMVAGGGGTGSGSPEKQGSPPFLPPMMDQTQMGASTATGRDGVAEVDSNPVNEIGIPKKQFYELPVGGEGRW